MIKKSALHWEKGYRCHGLWINGTRVAFIGLSPKLKAQKPTYSAYIDKTSEHKEFSSLPKAKSWIKKLINY